MKKFWENNQDWIKVLVAAILGFALLLGGISALVTLGVKQDEAWVKQAQDCINRGGLWTRIGEGKYSCLYREGK